MIVTDNEEWANLFPSLRNQGRDVFDGWHCRLPQHPCLHLWNKLTITTPMISPWLYAICSKELSSEKHQAWSSHTESFRATTPRLMTVLVDAAAADRGYSMPDDHTSVAE